MDYSIIHSLCREEIKKDIESFKQQFKEGKINLDELIEKVFWVGVSYGEY